MSLPEHEYALAFATPTDRLTTRSDVVWSLNSTNERTSDDQKRSQLKRLKHKLARSFTHSLRFSSDPWKERTEEEGKQAAQALRQPARQPAATSRRPDAAAATVGGERRRVLPQEEGERRLERAPVVHSRDAKRRGQRRGGSLGAAAGGRGREGGREGAGDTLGAGREGKKEAGGGESLTLLNCS